MHGCSPNDEAPVANASEGNNEVLNNEEGKGTKPVPARCARDDEDSEEDDADKEEQHAEGEVSKP